jgi:hypothetical protein
VFDVPREQVRVCVFLSEVKAQRLAVRLRQQSHVGALAVNFSKLLARRLPPLLRGKRRRRLRIVHPSVAPGAAAGAVLDRLPSIVPDTFIAKVQEWMVAAFSEFAKTQSERFLAAAEQPADGVTLVFTLERPPGLKELGQLFGDKAAVAANVAETIAKGAAPAVRVDALAGFKCE